MSTGTISSPAIRYSAVAFACPDPPEPARFHGDALGLLAPPHRTGLNVLGGVGVPTDGLTLTNEPPSTVNEPRRKPVPVLEPA
ncbi:hypothetical protein [Streptomyces sp. 142MFCol3.1]|uniref:hypothetical protein n=1 Tax=Streptomyces sp. 142MFCol3.1 TaxID=1172179 RepID=UPI000410D7EE|nr:hypothetical protein [Streptomyces sp. 142MFCol3.1]